MLLQRVIYELFGFEVEEASAGAVLEREGLRRQIRLEGAEGSRVYISWVWGNGQPDYFLAHATVSFFLDEPEAERDVSESPLWQALIGRPITVTFRDRSYQILEVRSGDAVVYCGSFQCDRIFLAQALRDLRPRPR
jgi:hypothetical protein